MRKKTIAVLLLSLLSVLAPSIASAQAWTPCSGPTCPVVFNQMIDHDWLNTFVVNNTAYLYNNLNAAQGSFRGLRLSTDPSSGTTKVLLRSADQIVMVPSGRSYTNWANNVADITLGGAGGLDTGTEQASTHYEVYAIAKSSDGTRNMLLHRAKDYFLDQNHDSDDTTSPIRRSTNSREAYGQGFQVTTTGLVEIVDVEIIRVGTVTGNIRAEIHSNAAGVPSGTVLATSDNIDASVISTTSHFIRFEFRVSPATLTAATTYHLVLTGTWTQSDANYIGWRTDTSAPGYANGAGSFKETTWQADAADASFKVYVTRNDTAVTMPSGYDERCLIGHVFNNFASDFLQFEARDRLVTQLTNLPIFTATSISNLTIQDLSSRLPPRPTMLWPTVDTGSATSVTLSPMPGIIGVAVTNSSLPRVAGSTKVNAANNTIVEAGPIPVSAYQYAYAINNGSSTVSIGTWSW